MATIRKRTWTSPSGEEKTAWQCDYMDAAGKRRSKQFSRKKDADAWLTTAAYEVQRGTHTPDSQTITIAKAAELWLTLCRNGQQGQQKTLEVSTMAAYEQHVRLHIVPLFGNTKLSKITAPMATDWCDQLIEKMSRPMAKRVLRSLKAIVHAAQHRGYVAQNVFEALKFGKVSRDKPKITVPTKPHLKAIIEAAKGSDEPMAYPLSLVLIYGGLRASELRGLPWRCINFQTGGLVVDQRADLKNKIGPPKSDAGYRFIPLPPSALLALKEWKLACPTTDDDLVFPSIAKRIMTHRYMSVNLMGAVQIAAGAASERLDEDGEVIKEPLYGLHEFRHAAASLWIEQKVSPKRVQKWMGHTSIQTTYDVYGSLFDQLDKDSAVAAAVEKDLIGAGSAT